MNPRPENDHTNGPESGAIEQGYYRPQKSALSYVRHFQNKSWGP
jgi:hypothetical protein